MGTGIKRLEREADHSSPSSSRDEEWVELYLCSSHTPSHRAQKELYLYQLHGKVYRDLPFKTVRPLNPKTHHRDHKISPFVILSCLNRITNFTIYVCNMNFNIILPSMTCKVSLSSTVYKRNVNPVSLTLVLHSVHYIPLRSLILQRSREHSRTTNL